MFGLQNHAPVRRPSTFNAQIRCEQLEERVCANAAPILNSFSLVRHLPYRQVEVTGTISDASPSSCSVLFGGVALGMCSVGTDRTFTAIVDVWELGTLTAKVVDEHFAESNVMTLQITNSPPQITYLHWERVEGGAYMVFWGNVSDEAHSGLIVNIWGDPQEMQGQQYTVTVQPNSEFSRSIFLPVILENQGTVCFQVTDWWGAKSDIYYAHLLF